MDLEIGEQLLSLSNAPDEQGNWEVIIKYNGDILKLETEVGVDVEILDENYAIITLKKEQIDRLYDYTEVEYIELPKTLSYNLEQELRSICTPTIENSKYNLTGERNNNCYN